MFMFGGVHIQARFPLTFHGICHKKVNSRYHYNQTYDGPGFLQTDSTYWSYHGHGAGYGWYWLMRSSHRQAPYGAQSSGVRKYVNQYIGEYVKLTLKVLNFWKFTSYCSLKPLWSGMEEVVPAHTSSTLHPPSPPTVHQLSWLAL